MNPETTFTATVLDIREESRTGRLQRWHILLDRTAFTPATPTATPPGTPPGTPLGTLEAVAPSGTRLQVPVLAVLPDGPDLWHIVEKPLAAGTPITGHVLHLSAPPQNLSS